MRMRHRVESWYLLRNVTDKEISETQCPASHFFIWTFVVIFIIIYYFCIIIYAYYNGAKTN